MSVTPSNNTAPGSSTAPLPGWDELAGPAGTELLAKIRALTDEGHSVPAVALKIRAGAPDRDLLAAALTQTELRAKAVPKFGELSPTFLFTQAGLEQASRFPVAALHAERFRATGCKSVADLGSGLGAESLAFQRAGLRVRAVEIDALTAQSAELRARVGGEAPSYEVLEGDATGTLNGQPSTGGADGVFLDPARRTAGHRDTKRLHAAAEYSPSLEFAFEAARSAHAGGIKLGPGFDRDLIPHDAEAQWVSVNGSLIEMGLWFGAAARENIRRSALLLTGAPGHDGGTSVKHELTAAHDSDDADERTLGEYILEPDGAVIRARLIGLLAEQLDAGMIHPGIAYLTSDKKPETPFAQVFRVLEELPSREKDLKKALATREIGQLEIKKRGVDVDPAALRTRLRLKGSRSATLILSRSAGKHVALLAERC